ncbi:hypothetical protein ACWDUC_34375, partial [Streptomyces tricolor]
AGHAVDRVLLREADGFRLHRRRFDGRPGGGCRRPVPGTEAGRPVGAFSGAGRSDAAALGRPR